VVRVRVPATSANLGPGFDALGFSIQSRTRGGPKCGSDRLWKVDGSLARSGVRKLYHRLPRSHHLTWFRESLHHGSVCVGDQERVVSFVPGNLCLRLNCSELCLRSIGGRFDLVVRRCGYRACADQSAISRLISCRLLRLCLRSLYILSLRGDDVRVVGDVDAHERLAGADHLSGIYKAFRYLARNSEAQVALHTGGDDAGERVVSLLRRLNSGNAHEIRLSPRVLLFLRFAASDTHRQRDEGQ